jgi:predicted dehydrogenase
MKQVLQDLKTGATRVEEVPIPHVSKGHLLVRSSCTLISAGTERMLVEFGKAGWIQKARQQPDKVRMVLDKIKTDGLIPTIQAVRGKLDQPLAMGYCNVGVVVAKGADVRGFEVGDRVASNGKHAEYVSVPINLAARIPDSVSDDEAAFTVLGAVGLQGVRLVQPSLGEAVAVIGCGLIGLLTVQLLRAHGCRVLAIDFDKARLSLASAFGAEVVDLGAGADSVAEATAFSRGRGMDAVIITAATDSSSPVQQAAKMCRKRGRIVLVGVAGLELSRADFYEKELTFQVSCSYGPGRYDPTYEERGIDYPLGFVRWTEQRNFEAVLDMIGERRIDVRPLISHRFDIDDAPKAYEAISGSEPVLGLLLMFPKGATQPDVREATLQLNPARAEGGAAIGFIGAGNYGSAILAPAFASTGATLRAIASSAGVSAVHVGKRYGFERATTDVDSLIAAADIDAVVVATRHNTHARYVLDACAHGKHVFVEKPLCITLDELVAIENVYRDSSSLLMVGFNRRFSPLVVRIKDLLRTVSAPISVVVTVNAGDLPTTHWAQDPEVGGGRIVGECCHFIDLVRFLCDSAIEDAKISVLRSETRDSVAITLSLSNGSIGTINYMSNGHKSFPKERVEVFAQGRVVQLDNFRSLRAYGWPGFSRMHLWKQDKGQSACVRAFVDALRNGKESPIPLAEILEVSRVSIELQEAAR